MSVLNRRASFAVLPAVLFAAHLLAATILLSITPLSAKTIQSEQGYVLDLVSNRPEKFRVQVTKMALRVDLNNAKCSLVSRAPDWNVVAWNGKDRTIMNVSNADWCQKYHMNKMHWAAELTKPLSVKEDWFMGVPALHCVFPSTEVVGLYMQSAVGKKNYKDNVDDLNRAIVVCLDCPSGKSSGSVFARFLGMPAVPGVPLIVKRIRATGKSESTLRAEQLHGRPISTSVFDIPQGFKKVPFSESFFVSKAQNENAKELFNSLLN
ncbi:hypothetical protein KBI23_19375 [bacterium]|nr:hypothetical protein [bacterium]